MFLTKNNKIFLVIICLCIFDKFNIYAYSYEKRILDKHILHVLILNPDDYEINIVKANNGQGGRESVLSIAKCAKAEIAINGGYFEIGAYNDGNPAGTLIIKNKVYNIVNHVQPLLIIKSNKIFIQNKKPKKERGVSIVSGIPMLVEDGEISKDILDKKSSFYLDPHARTAIGIKPDYIIVILVAEHSYSRNLKAMTVGEVDSLMREKWQIISQTYKCKDPASLTIKQLKEFLQKEFISEDGVQGLNILELADIMKELGCYYAINLDGGGSSALYINGEIVNKTIGDVDEFMGEEKMKAVSDIIIFKKR